MEKLDSKSLMIGDWVVYKGDAEYTNPIKIEGMDIATNTLITSDREDVGFNGVEPIPITIEILEKNGFKFNDGMFDWFRGDEDSYYTGFESVHIDLRSGFMSVLKEGKDGKQKQVRCDCSGYIHKLQHALKLCGIKKEIKL